VSVKPDYKQTDWKQGRQRIRRYGLLVIALILIGLFGALLAHIGLEPATNPPATAALPAEPAPISTQAVAPEPARLPAPPKPKYDFYNELPKRRVEVTADDGNRKQTAALLPPATEPEPAANAQPESPAAAPKPAPVAAPEPAPVAAPEPAPVAAPEPPPTIKPVVQPSTKPKPPPPARPSPPSPVAKATPPPAPKPAQRSNRYAVQVGSFRNHADADRLKASLAFIGVRARIEQTGSLHRVRIGPFSNRREAEAMRRRLQNNDFPAYTLTLD